MVLDATNCSLMTLKHLEGNLQLIYLKSSILTNLLVKEGSNTLHRVDRMTIAAGLVTLIIFNICLLKLVFMHTSYDIS
ncbi:unnamed protein product [Schistosoma curassoni]|uniref:Recep_L_domain domain-containing protein n=1 Tax=Schistosoma curassoni TaxID=6186 RepID=A0A183JQR6_9TREM|nr:unnamed protein product [Schistosoma curassoni]